MNGLGRRQLRMLTDIATIGQGQWPRGWRMSYVDTETLARLQQRGLVTTACRATRLTPEGRAVINQRSQPKESYV